MSKEDLRRAIQSITEKDVEKELEKLVKQPEKTTKELEKFTDKLTEKDVAEGVEKYGGPEGFLQAILYYLAFKAILIRKGIKVGVAAGAGAAFIFGTGSLCHSIANATGLAAVDGIADGIDTVGDMALSVSDVGFDIAEDGIEFFGDLLKGVLSIFGF